MALSMQQSKNRIKSIQSTKKITKAMELVSTSKLKRAKDIYFKMTPFEKELQTLMSCVVSNLDNKKNIYFNKNLNSKKKLYIIVTSSLGLCGGYDANIYRFIENKINKDNDDLIIFGLKGIHYFANKGFSIIDKQEELPQFNVKEKITDRIAKIVQSQYENQTYESIYMVYSKYINSLTFEPTQVTLLPLDAKTQKVKMSKELLIEPSKEEVLKELIPFYLNMEIKKYLFEAMLSEQASRRTAMENATDNAYELENQLLLAYNKARQAMITQEISEISSSADALK